jgi:hypothetical protein
VKCRFIFSYDLVFLPAIIFALCLPLSALADDFAPQFLPLGANISYNPNDFQSIIGSFPSFSIISPTELQFDPLNICAYRYTKTGPDTGTINYFFIANAGSGQTYTEQGANQLTFSTLTGGNITVSGSWIVTDTPSDNGTLSGSGAFNLTVLPITKKERFTQQALNDMARSGDNWTTLGITLGIAGGVASGVLTGEALAFAAGFFATSGGGTALIGVHQSALARDPSDPNFTTIAQPNLPPITPVIAGGIVTQGEADASNWWNSNLVQQLAYSQVIYTCINRAQGASDATNTYWETAQMNAAVQYEAQLAGFVDQELVLRSNVVATLVEGGFPAIAVTVDDAITFQTNIVSEGLPANLLNALTQLGAETGAITNFQDSSIVADPNAVAGTFPQSLIDTNLDSGGNALAADLRNSSLMLINVVLLPSGQLRFDLPTEPAYTYSIQFNQNLGNPKGWTSLLTTNATASLISFTNTPDIGLQAGFYRASLN